LKKIVFIGEVGQNKDIIPNGVNIKNRNLIKFLKSKEDLNLKIVDTFNWKKRIFTLFFSILYNSIFSDKIILSLNTKSAHKVISFLNLIKIKNKVIYIVVGGNFFNLYNSKKHIKKYSKLKKIFVQTKSMEKEGQKLGLKNISFLPNSKFFNNDYLIDNLENKKVNNPIKCYYLGRIHPDKGINMIFEALKKLNNEETKYVIDFYGPIENNYYDDFQDKISKYDFAKYKGILDLSRNENYKKLSEYDLFLFPTFWHGEGFPGAILDSFISGVPVLASDWRYNSEIIKNNQNGILFKSKSLDDLIDKLNEIYNNKDILTNLSLNAYKESKKYKAENIMEEIYNELR